uniref:Uncharacterized protein n=1 Tax=Scleropages formosus TaxID=113540 RepID=A0A8C9VRQ5_SCLFO
MKLRLDLLSSFRFNNADDVEINTVTTPASVTAVPLVLGAVGFTAAGVAAGSYAAGMMSATAVANGGAVAAGSAVAVLQSIGAAGLSGTASAAVASLGGTAGALLGLIL